jgi:hypothetical protein
VSLNAHLQGRPPRPGSESGENGLGLGTQQARTVGRPVGYSGPRPHGHPAESPFRFHTFGPPPRASRSLSLHHRSLSPAPRPLLEPLTASLPLLARSPPPAPPLLARLLVCPGPAIAARFALPFSDLQPSLRPASICDTSPAPEHLPHHRRPSLPPPLRVPVCCRPRLPSCVAPVHDGVTAPRFPGDLIRQPSTTLALLAHHHVPSPPGRPRPAPHPLATTHLAAARQRRISAAWTCKSTWRQSPPAACAHPAYVAGQLADMSSHPR